jgi:polyisoprenoid-binding protein YceI
VRGSFSRLRGTITVDEDPSRGTLEVVVETASVDTHHEGRDEDLRSARFFDVSNFPTMTFRSSSGRYDGDGVWEVVGELTIRDVTRPLSLQARFRGATLDSQGHPRLGFQAKAILRREDFKLTADLESEVGQLPVGTDVTVEVDAEATLRAS